MRFSLRKRENEDDMTSLDAPTDPFNTEPVVEKVKRRLWLKIGLPFVFAIIAIGFVAAWIVRDPPVPPRIEVEPPALLVQILPVAREPVRFTVTSQGLVTPRTQTTIVSEVTGHIVEVSPALESGGFFSQNEVLARIDPRNYETALKRAQADLAKAKTKVQTESALAGQALQDWEKLQLLSQDREAPSDLTLRKPQLAEVLAEMDLSQAALEKAQEDLDRTVIRAPFDGMIVEKLGSLGQFVNTGTQIATSISIELAEVRLPLSLRDFQYLDLEHLSRDRTVPVTLTADMGRDTPSTWQAEIVRSEGLIDVASRVVYVVAQVEEPYEVSDPEDYPLLMGTFVTAQITGREAGEVIVLPRHAIYGRDTVWVVNEEDKIQPRTLTIIRSDRNFSYVSEGLEDGDKVCITPIDQPIPGMRVRYSE